MPPHPAALDDDSLLAECEVQRTRRSGPGGQHRNKVETAVVVTHRPTGITAEASERRSQEDNRQQAVHRLRVKVAIELRTRAGEPSPRWRQRVRGGQIAVNPDHTDFPALLAEALDHLAAREYDTAMAAEALGVTPTQLIKLVRLAPAALESLNEERTARRLRTLK